MNATTAAAVLERRSPAASPSSTPRLDMYGPIHKALRRFMGDTLHRLGAADVDDDEERQRALDQLDALLLQMRSHLEHENDFIHTAIEARRPGGVRRFADDHLSHCDAIAALEDESGALRHARAGQRAAVALRLYRHLALFVAENLEHMQREEVENNAALWALYDDAELESIHDQLIASIAPAEMAVVLRWMCAALAPQELTGLFAGMRAKAPAEVFEGLIGLARQHLDGSRWTKLARSLGLPPVPGLMTA